MESKGDLHELLKTKDEQIKQLQRIVVQKDEEIEQLKSQLDKFQSVLPKALVQPRKVRAQGISAEPQSARSIKDCVTNNALRKYTKSNRYTTAQVPPATTTGSSPHVVMPFPGTSGQMTSTPASTTQHFPGPTVSEISSESGLTDVDKPELSGLEELQEEKNSNGEGESELHKKPAMLTKTGRPVVQTVQPQSFIDPFSVTLDVTLDESWLDDSEDPDYEPSFEISAVVTGDFDIDDDDLAFEEFEFGLDAGHSPIDEENIQDKTTDGVSKVTDEAGCEELVNSILCISFLQQVIALANIKVVTCIEKDCSELPQVKESFVGSALYLKWVCSNGHTSSNWCSQPQMNKRIHSGDFLVCASILTSGNNYGKLALWAKMLGLKFPSADQFHGIQSTYMVPTIDNYWKDHQKSVIDSFSGKPVVVMGDGRNDSPGHCAQYCSYTIMEQTSKKILTLITLDKRTTDRKSVNMEKVGFAKAMEEMKAKNIEVEEVVTDAHLGIGAIMKTSYPDIKHSHDIWHAAKSLGKRLLKVAQKKSNAVLGKWTKDIVNHFWFACKEASTYEQFVSIWRSVLHHITNQHSWILPHGDGETTCRHGPLSDEERNKPWLDPRKDCAVLKELASVVMDKRFLGKVHYYLNFRSTADLEGFHQLILMYAAKRFAYTPAVYRIRNELAALDHNNNADRPNIVNKDGTLRLQRTWNKKSSRWTAHPKKSEKSYTYVKDILRRALVMRIKDSVGMRKKRELEADDPRRIAAHLAPVEPLPTKVLMEEKVSRFK